MLGLASFVAVTPFLRAEQANAEVSWEPRLYLWPLLNMGMRLQSCIQLGRTCTASCSWHAR